MGSNPIIAWISKANYCFDILEARKYFGIGDSWVRIMLKSEFVDRFILKVHKLENIL